jgi:hypothetical protein
MSRRLSLHVTRESERSPSATVAALRTRLGGRASGDPGTAGDLVVLDGGGASDRVGVVLFARGDELDVWIADGLVRRTRRDAARSVERAPEHLAAIASDARTFASLVEGQRVRYELSPGGGAEGTLVEKCRFGALVLREDGKVVAAGFRRLSPAPPSADN